MRRASVVTAPPPPALSVPTALAIWSGPAAIAGTFIALATWSWRKWPDLLVDFGQQLYIPWQLSLGKHLYSDIALLHGPLSQYFNSLWFRLFGPSLTVLIVVNLAILASTTAAIYGIAKLCSDRLTAGVTTVMFLAIFAFSQYVLTGNYNYVTPYVHEATHGIALTAAMIYFLTQYFRNGRRVSIAAAGLCLGLVVLTKVDIAVAALVVAAVAAATGFVLKGSHRPSMGDVPVGAAVAVAPALMFFAYFLSYLPAARALEVVAGGFVALSGEVASNPFYRRTMGLDDVSGNVRAMASMGLWIIGFVVAGVAADRLLSRFLRRTGVAAIVLGAIACLAVLAQPELVPWRELPRALPLTTLACLVAVGAQLLGKPRPLADSTLVPALLWATFGLVLLGKIALNVHVFHYGFYLAMPSALLLVIALVYWVPRELAARFSGGAVFRGLTIGMLAAGAVLHLELADEIYRNKTMVVGRGGDTILAFNAAVPSPSAVVVEALRWIDKDVPPDATLVTLPEGIMINYLSRRATTLPEMNFMMTEAIIFGEDSIVTGLQNHPPDYLAIVGKDTSEFGTGPFGVDPRYGRRIMEWVNQHYTPAALVGHDPFDGKFQGVQFFKRHP